MTFNFDPKSNNFGTGACEISQQYLFEIDMPYYSIHFSKNKWITEEFTEKK
jgi:hypothetical protein